MDRYKKNVVLTSLSNTLVFYIAKKVLSKMEIQSLCVSLITALEKTGEYNIEEAQKLIEDLIKE